jgi:2-C-methyl-D-erythritol 4-phosphate cytidylyltransferase/2-C-methyl-D-erythritol 2,4-cyclodiphosphate synthase
MALYNILKNLHSNKPPACSVVIAAAGLSQRCKGEDKLFYQINSKPVLAYTIEAFQNCKLVGEIIVVSREESFEPIGEICLKYGFDKVTRVIKGGQSRLESVINGVFAVSQKSRLIAVHDGARPCVDIDTISKTIEAALKHNAAAPAVQIVSTVKRVSDDVISETIDRDALYEIQTPQVFRAELIKAALTKAAKKSATVTDDCMAVEILGAKVHIVEGSRYNLKITDAGDLRMAESILLGNTTSFKEREMRIGYGYDVHKLAKGRRCILCGVEIPNDFGPDGNSDADVPVHALIDAILGAAALGDIGKHFPESAPRWKDADSMELLKKAYALVRESGYTLGNADITIVLESPKLSDYIIQMREVLAKALETDAGNISVKATTEEQLGFTGNGSGIAASAVALLMKQAATIHS